MGIADGMRVTVLYPQPQGLKHGNGLGIRGLREEEVWHARSVLLGMNGTEKTCFTGVTLGVQGLGSRFWPTEESHLQNHFREPPSESELSDGSVRHSVHLTLPPPIRFQTPAGKGSLSLLADSWATYDEALLSASTHFAFTFTRQQSISNIVDTGLSPCIHLLTALTGRAVASSRVYLTRKGENAVALWGHGRDVATDYDGIRSWNAYNVEEMLLESFLGDSFERATNLAVPLELYWQIRKDDRNPNADARSRFIDLSTVAESVLALAEGKPGFLPKSATAARRLQVWEDSALLRRVIRKTVKSEADLQMLDVLFAQPKRGEPTLADELDAAIDWSVTNRSLANTLKRRVSDIVELRNALVHEGHTHKLERDIRELHASLETIVLACLLTHLGVPSSVSSRMVGMAGPRSAMPYWW